MCGICGFLGIEDKVLLDRMCRVIKHRGPDESGTYIDKNIGLGHQRLKIIDLKTGKQPIHNEEENIWITYNGEIYNFQELRDDLEEKGHQFYTKTDTEVIVHLYEEEGEGCVKKLNGMFAFALWDSEKKKLILCRDRVGMKPLHYTLLDDGTLLFASEIKSLLQYEKVKREVDPQALHQFINLRYIPKERTIFAGIKRLLPGHLMVCDEEGIKTKEYWRLRIKHSSESENYYIKKLKELLECAVKRHMISDVPIGVLLSGGIDSSSIVALASKFADKPIKTFCMGFGTENDEFKDAEIVSNHFNTEHHELVIDSHLLKEYPKMIWYADEPKRNLYPYYVSELASKHVKTALGGLGGDEVFAGYVFKYQFVSRIENIRRKAMFQTRKEISNIAKKLVGFQTKYGNLIEDEHLDYLEMMRDLDDDIGLYLITQTLDKVFDIKYLERIYSEKLLKERLENIWDVFEPYFHNNLELIDKVFLADFSVKMVDDFMLVDDRMNMAHSLETRAPFLDNNLVGFAFTIPTKIKLKDANGKYVLKKAMKDLLPKGIIQKEKQGFASETYQTYLRELREIALQKLPEGNLVKEGYFKKEYITQVLNELPNPRLRLHYDVIWNMLSFEIWYEIFINSDNPRKPKLNINDMI